MKMTWRRHKGISEFVKILQVVHLLVQFSVCSTSNSKFIKIQK